MSITWLETRPSHKRSRTQTKTCVLQIYTSLFDCKKTTWFIALSIIPCSATPPTKCFRTRFTPQNTHRLHRWSNSKDIWLKTSAEINAKLWRCCAATCMWIWKIHWLFMSTVSGLYLWKIFWTTHCSVSVLLSTLFKPNLFLKAIENLCKPTYLLFPCVEKVIAPLVKSWINCD